MLRVLAGTFPVPNSLNFCSHPYFFTPEEEESHPGRSCSCKDSTPAWSCNVLHQEKNGNVFKETNWVQGLYMHVPIVAMDVLLYHVVSPSMCIACL